jgi:hypothetical protein
MTPEEAEEFMYYLNIKDSIEVDCELGENGKREIVNYKGKVILKNENNFWIKENNKNNTEYNSPQVIWPLSIQKYSILDSPSKNKFGNR